MPNFSAQMTSTAFVPTKVAAVKAPVLTTEPVKHYPINSFQYENMYGNEADNNLNGGDGSNYISAGGGNDYIFSGNNNSTWHGSGNEFTAGASYLDGGWGNDTIQVWADNGAFVIDTGTGKDHVLISNDADYVRINNYADSASDAGDTFEFGMDFSGDAVIWSFDTNDLVKFNGLHADGSKYGDWTETNYGNGTTMFHNEVTGGTIEVQHDSQHQVRDVFVDNIGPSASLPYGGIMFGGELFITG